MPGTRRRRLLAISGALLACLALLLFLLRGSDDAGRPAAPSPEAGAEAPSAGNPPRTPPRAPPAESAPEGEPPAGSAAPPASAAGSPTARLRIHGRVVDEGGSGVAGAEVDLRAWSGREPAVRWTRVRGATGEDGVFDLSLDPAIADAGFGVSAMKEGHVEGWIALKAGEYDEASGVEVVAPGAREVAGRVVDGHGSPLPGSTVQLWYGSDTTWPTTVDGGGRFLTPRRAPKRAMELVVEAPGHPRRIVPLPAAAEDRTEVGDIVFRAGGRVAGIVVDRRGNPVPDLPLSLLGVAPGGPREPRARSDGAGRFEFTDIGEGTVGVCVDAPGEGGPAGARRRYRGVVEGVVVGSGEVRLVVGAECVLVLRFVDADSGEPVDVRRAVYGVRPEGTPEPERLPESTASDSPLLSVRTSVLSGERFDLTLRAEGFRDVLLTGVDPGDGPEKVLDLRMERRR